MDKQAKDFEKGWEEIKEYCGDCEAWSGTDCTRNPITQDCLKERKQKQIEEMAKFSFMVIDNKTGKEADIGKIALKEDWAKGLIYCDMEGFAILEDGNLVLLDECGNVAYCPCGRFTVIPEGAVLTREEYERLVKTAQGKIGNMKANDFLKACISSGIMVEAVSTEEQVKQAYEKGSKETAEKFAVLRKYITEQCHHYHEVRDEAESEYKKCKDEYGKAILNNDWHRADAIMFILEKVGIEFDEIAKEIVEGVK